MVFAASANKSNVRRTSSSVMPAVMLSNFMAAASPAPAVTPPALGKSSRAAKVSPAVANSTRPTCAADPRVKASGRPAASRAAPAASSLKPQSREWILT